MGHQAEYLARRNLVPRRQITTHLSILFVFLVVSYVAVWYFWPTTYPANLPYCVNDFFLQRSPTPEQMSVLEGVYMSPRAGARMDNFDIPWTYFLRFNENGQVMYAVEVGVTLNWRQISKWFDWGTTAGRAYVGTYEIIDDQILITLNRQSDGLRAEWQGRIINGTLRFESNKQLIPGAFAGTNTVIFKPYNVERCPLTADSPR